MRASSVDHYILRVLEESSEHITSAQVFERVRLSLPAVNPSTVYRALERLARSGKVSVSDLGKGAMVYQSMDAGEHDHLVCQGCGQMIHLEHERFKALFDGLEAQTGYRMVTNHLVLWGLCPGCQHQGGAGG